jgi:2-polyprenyl-3-methyl-5-hydroxy-6-metoxy-1,4-benzoquinol methylase
MATAEDHRSEMDRLRAELRATVEERFRSGEYPAELESELSRHFEETSSYQHQREERFSVLLKEFDEASNFDPARIPTESSLPLGSQLHQAIGKVTKRQITGVLLQMQEHARAIRALLIELKEIGTERTSELSARVDVFLEELAAAGRQMEGSRAADHGANGVLYRPWFARSAFMSQFGGSRDEILRRYRPLAKRFDGLAPVVDIGSGRGEMLELLAEMRVEAIGVDMDAELVAVTRQVGMRVEVGDGVAYLNAQNEGLLGGIFAGHVIEHLAPQHLLDLIALASTRLRPGGRLILETLNPESLWVLAHSYHLDPTHVSPIPPMYLEFLARDAGFSAVEIEYHSPVHQDARLQLVPEGLEMPDGVRALLNRNFERLNGLVYGDQDYALIATR